jgi:hypothetical protein
VIAQELLIFSFQVVEALGDKEDLSIIVVAVITIGH